MLFLVITQTCFAQKYDSHLISKKKELNFSGTEMRGLENNGITYFVENDLQTLSAHENGKLKWKTNIISVCGKPSVGKPEIRLIKYKGDKLLLVYGYQSFAEVKIINGKTKFIGSD